MPRSEVLSTSSTNVQPKAAKDSVFAAKLDPIYSEPVSINIDSINLSLPLEHVGIDSSGTMETPKGWNNAGWYYKAAKAGEEGNLIVNGHYDNNYGGPAAFWNLKNVKAGDTIEIVDTYGRLFEYSVLKSYYVEIDDPNRLQVLNDQEGKSTLTLITCGGVYLANSGYTKRLVIEAQLRT